MYQRSTWYDRPSVVFPVSERLRTTGSSPGAAARWASHWSATRSPFCGRTTESAPPWTTIAGGNAVAPGRGAGTSVRAPIAASACAGPLDDRYAGAEWAPTAANTSG